MVEEPVKMKKKDQMSLDEELAFKLQAEEEEEEETKAEITQESISKRAGDELEHENPKKQKVDEDKETAELQRLIKVVFDEEEVAIDVVPLATKPPTIVNWKIHKEGKKSYYQIIRADGTKYGLTRPVEDLDLILYGDLKKMFKPHVEDQIWKNQDNYSVLDWKIYDSCGVHSCYFDDEDRKGIENVAADHLSRIENDEISDDSEVDDNFHGEALMKINTEDEPSHWLGPYVVKHQYPSGYVELYGKDGKTFIVNGHRLKLYHEEEDYYNDQREAVTLFFPKE
ncbi:hypothetical protein Tco_0974734 [Tanacetum coccineum]|uniref:Uncharacterized protein n=1 Tax=Tanacetum coccineum TaxID=301880 RepID=A0ABQ5ECJ8_9ASTR